jgi:hypothetical protein
VAVDWRRLHNEELYNFYASPNIVRSIRSRRMRWAGRVLCTREMRNRYKILVVKPEGRVDNIRMDLREVCWEGVCWMGML